MMMNTSVFKNALIILKALKITAFQKMDLPSSSGDKKMERQLFRWNP
jgi:hypothetical protein